MLLLELIHIKITTICKQNNNLLCYDLPDGGVYIDTMNHWLGICGSLCKLVHPR